jgi:CheY-like chemotaxis protein/anti-sigma regulatory factor (Ser/Thr protein kinase)
MDRHLVGRLLGKDRDADWVVEFAENGAQALEFIKDVVPDVVVTDMIMPEMNGLQLVEAVRRHCPQVPVVLVTGQGNEEVAVEALDRGAASYVPKRDLAEKLVDTLRQVLSVSRADHSYRWLTECFARHQLGVQMPNDTALIAPLVDLVQRMLTEMNFCDPAERMHLGIALEEALLNALYHGNLELPAEQAAHAHAEVNEGRMSQVVEDRCAQVPYCDRKIFVDVLITREEARFVVRDQGAGFAHGDLPVRGDPHSLERGAGRGLVLMHNFMDEVVYNEAGNEVTLVKRRTGARIVEG